MIRPDVVGVDGCKSGWFAVRLPGRGEPEVARFSTFGELLECYAAADLILVDIPIGLPEGPGGRECDGLARKAIGPRRSSVFSTPTRQTTQQVTKHPRDYVAARSAEFEVSGRTLLKQAFEIAGKIAEVDGVVGARLTSSKPRIREIHPELCFWALGNKQTLSFHKSRPLGYMERLSILFNVENRTEDIVETSFSSHWRDLISKKLMEDDILDALAAAVTGYHGYDALKTLPEDPPCDAKKLPMEMVYWVPPAV